ncbi:MAG: ArsR family transcriptional regulator [Salibacteraceae bacterium]
MLESLISSKTRVKLLLRFFLNPERDGYLRALSGEFGESTNSVRLELNRLERAGILTSKAKGNKKIFKTNDQHPMYSEMRNMVLKHVGIVHIIENVIDRLGDVKAVFVTGELAMGRDSNNIDLILVGQIDESYLKNLCKKAEKLVKRTITYLLSDSQNKVPESALLVWSREVTDFEADPKSNDD